jgi:predicted ATPase
MPFPAKWGDSARSDILAGKRARQVHLRQALASPEVGPESFRSYWLATLAEAYGRAGQPQAGLEVLAEAMALITTREMRWWEAEVYRLQGELRLQLPAPDVLQADAFFLSALDVARRQQAKALELRAACSLSRLKYQQGHLKVAGALLSMLGSPKVLTHLIYWRPRPCLQR